MKIFKHDVLTKQAKGLKALVISDIHFYSKDDFKKLKEIIEELENNHYDAIYLIGDIMDATNVLVNDKATYEILIDFVRILGNFAPTYLAFGSHDLVSLNQANKPRPWSNDEETFKLLFLEVVRKFPNIYVEDNKTYELPNGDTVSMVNPDLKSVLYLPEVDEAMLMANANLKFSFLNNLDYKKTNTLLCHYPGVIMSFYKKGMLNPINVSVAGHNHNGLTQLRIFPLEGLFNLLGAKNRGIITPGKEFDFRKTKYLRGRLDFDDEHSLIFNPAITSLAAANGLLHKFDPLFYNGATSINYVPLEELEEKKVKTIKYDKRTW